MNSYSKVKKRTTKLKLSIIIPTMNREKDLWNCVNSVIKQTVKPDELIIVDDGDLNASSYRAILQNNEINSIYIRKKEQGLTKSRNLGVASASGDIVLFLDDDVILDNAYIENILKVFACDALKKIGGVSGVIINIPKPTRRDEFWHFMERLFCISSKENGRILPSGFRSGMCTVHVEKKVDLLTGCNMAYRKEVFSDLQFDEYYKGYAFGEDRDFSYRVSKKYDLVITPHAKVQHLSTNAGRIDICKLNYMRIINQWYFFKKNMQKSFKNCCCFCLALFGLMVINILHFSANPSKINFCALKGTAYGIRDSVRSALSIQPS